MVTASILCFGEFQLDSSRFELYRAGHSLRLERKPLELLVLLTSRDGDLVSRPEIAQHLWGAEVFVDTEHGINTAIRKLRQALRDDPEKPRFVQTVTGKGYRFIGAIQPSPAAPSTPPSPATPPMPALPPTTPPAAIHSSLRAVSPRVAASFLALASLVTLFFVLAVHRRKAISPGKEGLGTSATQVVHASDVAASANRAEAAREYFRGRYLWYSGHYGDALLAFRRATEVDPEYALGWTGLSAYYGAGAVEGQLDPRTSLLLSKTTANKAAALEPTLPEAHLGLAAAALLSDWQAQTSLDQLDEAIRLNPDFAEAYHFRAKVLAVLDRHDEAIEAQKHATDLDPFARPWALSLTYLLARRYDLALGEARLRIAAAQDSPVLEGILSEILHGLHRESESMDALAASYLLTGDNARALQVRRAFARGGEEGLVRWQITNLEAKAAHQYVSPVELASLYARLGDRDSSLRMLGEGAREHSPLLLWVRNSPDYDLFNADPRFRALLPSPARGPGSRP